MNDTESKWNLYQYTPVDALGELTNLITKTHFPQYTCVGVITEGSTGIMDYVPHSNFRFHIHIGDDSPISKLEETAELDYNKLDGNTLRFEELLIVSLDAGCPFYVVQVSNPKAAVHCFARASRRAQFRSSRKYLFLPMFKNGEIVDLKEDIFLMKEMDYFPDLVIAKLLSQEQDSQDSYDNLEINSEINSMKFHYKIELYTHQFKGREKSKILLVDTWRNNENSLRSMNIFPDKVRNVEGREVIIVTWYYAPFIVLNFNKRPPLYDGIEFRVAREFLIFVNASVRITMDPNNYWGDAFDNGTGNGVLGLMAMDKGDVGFSAFYAWPSSFKVVDFSNTHMRSSVTMMAPRPKLKPGWLMPIMPFSGAMWMAVGACYLGATFTLYKFQNFADKLLGRPGDAEVPFSKLDYTALWLFAMLMSQGPDYKLDSSIPRQVPTRHFIAWFLVIGEVICDTYSAGLAYVLSTPRFEPPIEWVEDLWTRHVIWAGNHVAWIWSIEKDESPMLKDITANFRVMTEESMNTTGRKSGDIAFGIERLQGGHFTTESHINEGTVAHRRIMKDTLYWSHLYFLLRKGSPYKQHFNTLVNRLREAGLLLYWEGDVIRHYMSERLQVAISTSRILHDEDGANKLTLNQLQGAFFLLILGGILGTIAFAAELIVRPEKKQQMKLNSNDEKSVNENKLESTRLN
ncbi:Ionotropic receptor 41a7 [Blattella germanica]|nr:Ionotropic receptor 41a7 [Blattella germanica]